MKKKLGLLLLAVVLVITSTVTGTLANEVDDVSSHGIQESVSASASDLIQNEMYEYQPTPVDWIAGKIYGGDLHPGATLTKNVCVTNITSNVDVLVRSWFAFEADTTGFAAETAELIALNQGFGWDWKYVGQDTIDGIRYDIYVAAYRDVLSAGSTTQASLVSVTMNKDAGNLQVTQFGGEYEIKVISQAVEANTVSLDAAFGTDHPWKG